MAEQDSSKVTPLPTPKIIATHDGTFHCDEVLACYMLTNHTKEYKNATIIRTRNPLLLSKADLVVDVGGVFNFKEHKFDHHQKTFNEVFSSKFKTKLSSSGLIHKYFGKKIIFDILSTEIIQYHDNNNNTDNKYNINFNQEFIEIIWYQSYENFFEYIDATDNGINSIDIKIKKKYKELSSFHQQIQRMNPFWTQLITPKIEMEYFQKAMIFAGNELISHVLYLSYSWFPAKIIVSKATFNRYNIHKSGKILLFDKNCQRAWLEHIYKIEPIPIYVIYQDIKQLWRVFAVPVAPNSFELFKPFPIKWRGLFDKKLCSMSKIDGSVFVHKNGFMAINKSYEGALKMASTSLEYMDDEDKDIS